MDKANLFSANFLSSLILVSLLALLSSIYLVRVFSKGRARFERVNRQGGSVFLSKKLMEMVYWALEPLARLFVFMGVRPNALTWSALVFGFLAALCLGAGHFGFGATFAACAGLLDALDGMVARLSGTQNAGGEILDSSVDRVVEFLFIAGLVLYYRNFPAAQVVALLALLGSFLVSYSTAKAEAFGVEVPRGAMRRPERAAYLTIGALLSPITIPWLESGRVFSPPVAHPMIIALIIVAVFSNLSAIERFRAIAAALRDRQRKEAVRLRVINSSAPCGDEESLFTPKQEKTKSA